LSMRKDTECYQACRAACPCAPAKGGLQRRAGRPSSSTCFATGWSPPVFQPVGVFCPMGGHPRRGVCPLRGHPRRGVCPLKSHPRRGVCPLRGHPRRGVCPLKSHPRRGVCPLKGHPLEGVCPLGGHPRRGVCPLKGHPLKGVCPLRGHPIRGVPLAGRLERGSAPEEARGAPFSIARVLRTPARAGAPPEGRLEEAQHVPVRPLWGGLRRRAVLRLEGHACFACRAGGQAAARAGAPREGRLEEARGAPFRRARVFRTPCWWASCSACRCAP
jgi:hypothetical protein